jgi:hypothetical protein
MKQHYTLKTMLMFITFLFIAFTINSQIRIVNVNPETEAVTIKNYGSASDPMDISSFRLCNWPSYDQLGGMTILNGSLDLAVGASVTVTSDVALGTSDGELGLYNSSSFGSSDAMEDYMQWGSAGHFRESVAVAAGVWTAGTFVNVTPPYEYVGDGTQNGALFWDTSLSLESLVLDNTFIISPNPSSNYINIRFAQIIDNAQIELFNVLGNRMISRFMNNSATERININEWSNGVYFIRIKTSTGTQTKRFVKQ